MRKTKESVHLCFEHLEVLVRTVEKMQAGKAVAILDSQEREL
jgi:hypothetical protein